MIGDGWTYGEVNVTRMSSGLFELSARRTNAEGEDDQITLTGTGAQIASAANSLRLAGQAGWLPPDLAADIGQFSKGHNMRQVRVAVLTLDQFGTLEDEGLGTILHFAHHAGRPHVWYEMEPGQPVRSRRIVIYGTGANIPENLHYIRTAMFPAREGAEYGGETVWHLYASIIDTPPAAPSADPAARFVAGDAVRLKNGSPVLTIVRKSILSTVGEVVWDCTWFDSHGQPHTVPFLGATLVPVRDLIR